LSPTTTPSAAPSAVPASGGYTLKTALQLTGASVQEVYDASESVIAYLASAAGVAADTVTITAVRLVAATRVRDRALTAAYSEVDVVVTGIEHASTADAAAADLDTYLGSGQFFADIAADIPAATAAVASSVSSVAVSTPEGSDNTFDHSCQLSTSMDLSWTVGGDDTVLVQLSLADSGNSNWLSGGLVRSADYMVPKDSHRHSVYTYDPTDGAGYYQINGYSAGSFERSSVAIDSDSRNRISSLQKGLGLVQLSFTQAPDTDSSAAFTLDTSGSNVVIWAHGGDWPVAHTPTDSGFVHVNWADGTCVALSTPSALAPFIVFLPLAFILIFTCVIQPFAGDDGIVRSIADFLTLYKLPILHMFDETSVGGVLMIVVHLVLCIVVGESSYRSNSFGSSSSGLDQTGLVQASGVVTMMNLWVGLLPAAKTSLWTRVGMSYERNLKYHKMVVTCAMVAAAVHLVAAMDDGVDTGSQIEVGHAVPLFGTLGFICLCIAFFFAADLVRTNLPFELFKATHGLNLVAIVLVLLHLKMSVPVLVGFLPGVLLHCKSLSFAFNALSGMLLSDIHVLTLYLHLYLHLQPMMAFAGAICG